MGKFADSILNALHKEPAVVLGAVLSVVTLVTQAIVGDITWLAALPAITGIVVRFFVFSPASVDEVANVAHVITKAVAQVAPAAAPVAEAVDAVADAAQKAAPADGAPTA